MKLHVIILLFISFITIGCNSSSNDSNTTQQANVEGVDGVQSSSSSSNQAVEIEIKADSAEAKIIYSNTFDINLTQPKIETVDEKKSISVDSIDEDIVGKAFFLNGQYEGIVETQTTSSGTTKVVLKEAQELSEIIDSFDIDVDASSATIVQQRSFSTLIGRYDSINKQPLTYEIKTHSIYNAKLRKTIEEPVLRINFPKGYTIPIHAHSAKLLSSPARKVEFDFSQNWEKNFDLDYQHEEANLSISTEGSYIEFGLGVALHAEGRTRKAVRYVQVSLGQSASFESNLEAEIIGHLQESWSDTLELTSKIQIVIPISNLVSINIEFIPELRLSASGQIDGYLTANSHVERDGSYEIDYDSRRSSGNKVQTTLEINSEATPIDEHNLHIDINADGHAIIAPVLKIKPEVSFARIMDLEFVSLRGGVDIDTYMDGHFNADFEVLNTTLTSEVEAGVNINIQASPWLSYQMYVSMTLIGRAKKPIVMYDGAEKDLYRADPIEMFDWGINLLAKPNIALGESPGLTYVNFSLDPLTPNRIYAKYYYTLDGSTPQQTEAYLWDNIPLEVTENVTVKVQAVLKKSDYSDSIWAIGKSISPVASLEVQVSDPTPEAPLNLQASESNPLGISVSWEESEFASEYALSVSESAFGEYTRLLITNELSYFYTSSSEMKYFKVQGCNESGLCGDYSNYDSGQIKSLNTLNTARADAGADQVVVSGKTYVTLDASNSSANALTTITKYEWKEGNTLLSNALSFEKLYSTGTHTITLTITDSSGQSASDSVVVKVKALPTTPTNVSLSSGINSVTLKWDNVAYVTHYKLYVRVAGSTQGTYIYALIADNIAQPSGEFNLTFSTYTFNATDDTEYYYKVQACDSEIGFCGDMSEAVHNHRIPTVILVP